VTSALAHGKINLALVVGPTRPDGMHEVVTILQRIDLCDTISIERAAELTVEGFAADTIVRAALLELAAASGTEARWRVEIDKRIPVAAGLGGGSSDAATALRLANDELDPPLEPGELLQVAQRLGADVPFFLERGPQLGTGDGSTLRPLDLPQSYAVLLVLPFGAHKESTAAVYGRFEGANGFVERRAVLLELAAAVRHPTDLAELPRNDLVSSSDVADELFAAGAFRADVSGAGPTVYGLFPDRRAAEDAASTLGRLGSTWVAEPAW
jgi:4-diphosphocytidyl-2-C-methyl-D-erythritol kinase